MTPTQVPATADRTTVPDPTLFETIGDSVRYLMGGLSTAAFRQPTSPGQGTTQRGTFEPSKARTWAGINSPEGFKARYGLTLDGDATKGYLQGESFVPGYVERWVRHPSNPAKIQNHTNFTVDQVAEQDLKTVLIGGAAAYKHVLAQYEATFHEAPWKGTSKPIVPRKPVETTEPIEPTKPAEVIPTEPEALGDSEDAGGDDTRDGRDGPRIAELSLRVTQLENAISKLAPGDDILGTLNLIKSWTGETSIGKGRVARLKRLARYVERVNKTIRDNIR